MNQNDKKRFVTSLISMAEIYRKNISADAQKMWFELLEEFPIESIEIAFRRLMRNADNSQFMPMPGDVVRIIEGSSGDAAAVACTKAVQAIGSPGPYFDVCFDDPIINRVISDLGGWIKFCSHLESEMPFVENDFKARYKAYRSRGSLGEYPKQLTGISNSHNGTGGFNLEPVALCGDKKKAEQVLLGGVESTALITTFIPQKISVVLGKAEL